MSTLFTGSGPGDHLRRARRVLLRRCRRAAAPGAPRPNPVRRRDRGPTRCRCAGCAPSRGAGAGSPGSGSPRPAPSCTRSPSCSRRCRWCSRSACWRCPIAVCSPRSRTRRRPAAGHGRRRGRCASPAWPRSSAPPPAPRSARPAPGAGHAARGPRRGRASCSCSRAWARPHRLGPLRGVRHGGCRRVRAGVGAGAGGLAGRHLRADRHPRPRGAHLDRGRGRRHAGGRLARAAGVRRQARPRWSSRA